MSAQPLSVQLLREAERQLARGSEIGLFLALRLQELAIDVRSVESSNAPPISLEVAFDRLATRMPGWPIGPHAAVDAFVYAIS